MVEAGGALTPAARAQLRGARARYPAVESVLPLLGQFEDHLHPTVTTRKLVVAAKNYIQFVRDVLKCADSDVPTPGDDTRPVLDNLYSGTGGPLDIVSLRATGVGAALHTEKSTLVTVVPPGFDTRKFCAERHAPGAGRGRQQQWGDWGGGFRRDQTPRGQPQFFRGAGRPQGGRGRGNPGLPPNQCCVCGRDSWSTLTRRCSNNDCRCNTRPRQGGGPG